MKTLFHLAFPVHDFDLAKQFYHEQLGFGLGRESEQALIFEFGSHQIVAHKIDLPLVEQQGIYPRHFGLIFLEHSDYRALIHQIETKNIPFQIAPKVRFPGTPIEHESFFLKDPSNNLLEFKFYTHYSAIFNKKEWKLVGEAS